MTSGGRYSAKFPVHTKQFLLPAIMCVSACLSTADMPWQRRACVADLASATCARAPWTCLRGHTISEDYTTMLLTSVHRQTTLSA